MTYPNSILKFNPKKTQKKYFTKWTGEKSNELLYELSLLYKKRSRLKEQRDLLNELIASKKMDSESKYNYTIDLIDNLVIDINPVSAASQMENLHKICRSLSLRNSSHPCIKQTEIRVYNQSAEWYNIWARWKDKKKSFGFAADKGFRIALFYKKNKKREASIHFSLGEIQFNLKNYKLASSDYENSARINLDKEAAKTSWYSAIYSHDLHTSEKWSSPQRKRLRILVDNYVKLFPEDAESKKLLIKVAKIEDKYKQDNLALTYYKKVFSKYPSTKEARMSHDGYTNILIKKKNYKKLIAFIHETIFKDEKNPTRLTSFKKTLDESYFKLSEYYEAKNKSTAALKVYSEFLDKRKGSSFYSKALWNRANTYFKLKKYDNAGLDYLSYYKANTKTQNKTLLQDALSRAADSYKKSKNVEQVLYVVTKLQNYFPKSEAKWKTYLAEVYVENKLYDKALNQYLYIGSKTSEFKNSANQIISQLLQSKKIPHTLSTHNHLATYAQRPIRGQSEFWIAEKYLSEGKKISASRLYKKISKNKANLPLDVAKSLLRIVQIESLEFKKFSFKRANSNNILPLLESYLSSLDKLKKSYLEVVKKSVLETTVTSLRELSVFYWKSSEKLILLKKPKGVSKEEFEDLKKEILAIAKPLFKEGMSFFKKAKKFNRKLRNRYETKQLRAAKLVSEPLKNKLFLKEDNKKSQKVKTRKKFQKHRASNQKINWSWS